MIFHHEEHPPKAQDRNPVIMALRLCATPVLLPTLMDGLVWRSRLTRQGVRRVNYYVTLGLRVGHWVPVRTFLSIYRMILNFLSIEQFIY